MKRNGNFANKCRRADVHIDRPAARTVNNRFPIKSIDTMTAVINLQKFARYPRANRRRTLVYAASFKSAMHANKPSILNGIVFKHFDNFVKIKVTYPINMILITLSKSGSFK